MMPTLASTWRKMRSVHDKRDVRAHRSQSEVISGVRLHALMTTAPVRSRASSVETTSSRSRRGSRSTCDEHERTSEWDMHARSRGDSGSSSSLELKVFVGSWNMAAKDPFVASTSKASATYVGDAAAGEKLQTLLSPGYDLYVVGIQEKVTKHLHAAVLVRLHAAPENLGRRFVVLRQPSKDEKHRRHSRQSHSTDRNSESSTSNDRVDRFRHGSIAVEASASGYHVGAATGETNQKDTNAIPRESIQEVRGRGDGAFLNTKSTSIAVYCAWDLADVVEIEASATHTFSWTSGSKGGVATLTFANCHLEANKPALRRQQLATLSAKLGQALGAKDLASSSDHVVWMGDFNYRIHTLDGETVLKLISSGKHLEVHERYDSMQDELAMLPTTGAFVEPHKWPTFLAAYKKIPGRPASVDMGDPN